MKMFKKFFHYLFNKPAILGIALLLRFSPIIPDKLYLKLMFRLQMGYWMDFKSPKTFNEKLQWLKLYNRNPEYTRIVDKLEVKEYIANIIGAEHIIPTLGVWGRPEDIDFDSLPEKFVLKTTHGGGSNGVIVCRDKSNLDKDKTISVLRDSMRQNIYSTFKEWPYKDVLPRIIAEQYLEDAETKELRDYKFFCFNGCAEYYKVDFDRFVGHRANYFDRNGLLMKFGEEVCPPDYDKKIEMPDTLPAMMNIAEKLSHNIPFVRVDLYSVNQRVYFGEMTFFPAAGFGRFIEQEWDKKLGDLISLELK